MARKGKTTPVVDEIQSYLNGVAKNLVDRRYGPKGPAWGTRLSEIEETVLALRQHLSERLLHHTLQRQADAVEDRPEPFQTCPSCHQAVNAAPPHPGSDAAAETTGPPRCLDTLGGEAHWHEPNCYCHSCRRSFSPSVPKPGR